MNAKKMNKALKTAVAALSVVLVICLSVAGTLAWLQDSTDPVINTFTPSNIGLTLVETATDGGSATANTYKMVPGVVIAKDPKVTVTADVDSYVFVKVEESANFDDFMTYAIASGWKLYDSGATTIDTVANDSYVLYREVTAEAAADGESFYVLAGNTANPNGIVTVKNDVTKENMQAITSNPTLKFTAYAIQVAGFEDNIQGAWTAAQNLQN